MMNSIAPRRPIDAWSQTITAWAFAALALGASASHAQSFVLSGALDDGDAPADGVFAVDLAVVDEGNTVWTEHQDGVVVVDGVFALDVGAVTPLDRTFTGGAQLVVTIDGDELSALPLARVILAEFAARADTATDADLADTVGGVAPDDVVTVAELATVGPTKLPYRALRGVPVDDVGTDVTLGANSGLTLTGRTLALGSVPGSKLATGAVATANLPAGSVTSAKVATGAVTTAHVQDGSLTSSDVADFLTAREVATVPIFIVTAEFCREPAGSLSKHSTCNSDSGAVCQLPNVPLCNFVACGTVLQRNLDCLNTLIGEVVQP